jgi:hypothetical protein
MRPLVAVIYAAKGEPSCRVRQTEIRYLLTGSASRSIKYFTTLKQPFINHIEQTLPMPPLNLDDWLGRELATDVFSNSEGHEPGVGCKAGAT